jgi:glycosyltransferase involved in cell wall biosynthesis
MESDIAIVHPSLNIIGGAEILCLNLIRQLYRDGYKIKLYTIDRVNWDKLEKSYGTVTRPNDEYYFFNKLPTYRPEIINWFILLFLYLYLLIKSKKSSLLSWNNYGEILPFISDISYVNSVPLICFNNSRFNPFGIPRWKFTSKIFLLGYSLLSLLYNRSNILTNSKYVSSLLSGIYKTHPIIIYPPISINNIEFITNKQKNVLIVTRISKGKNLKIIPEIFRAINKSDLKLIIMGSVDETSLPIIEYIKKKSEQYGIKENITFISNPRRDEIFEKMRESLIYLSTQSTEAFGMAIVESMLHSCIPIVPKSGGPWYDILNEQEGKVGYAYSSTSEAAKKIETILKNKNSEEIQKKALKRAKKFHIDIFNKKISFLIHKTFEAFMRQSLKK